MPRFFACRDSFALVVKRRDRYAIVSRFFAGHGGVIAAVVEGGRRHRRGGGSRVARQEDRSPRRSRRRRRERNRRLELAARRMVNGGGFASRMRASERGSGATSVVHARSSALSPLHHGTRSVLWAGGALGGRRGGIGMFPTKAPTFAPGSLLSKIPSARKRPPNPTSA